MSFIFCLFELSNGGVSFVLINLINELSIRNINVSLILDEKKCDSELLAKINKKVNIIYKPNNISKLRFLRKIINHDNFYIGVQSHNAMLLAISSILKKNVKIIAWEHSNIVSSLFFERSKIYSYLFIFLRFILYYKLKSVFFVSKSSLDAAQKITPKKINSVVYRNPVINDRSKINHLNKNISKKVKFISIGRLSKEKNIELAIRALSKVKFDWHYVIVGDGPEMENLKQLVVNKSLEENIKFTGWVDSPNMYLQDSDVLILTSKFEGMPTVIIDACFYNIPVITSNCFYCNPPIIVDNKNGYIFEVNNEDDLVNKLNQFNLSKYTIKNSDNYILDFFVKKSASLFVGLIK